MNKRAVAGLNRAATLYMISAFFTIMVLTVFPLVNASIGYIRIHTTATSIPGQEVAAGGDVNLYVGGVTWSGAQLYLMLSKDGFSQVSSGDLRFTPTFNLANVTARAITTRMTLIILDCGMLATAGLTDQSPKRSVEETTS